jgi:hypothetical protein
VVFVFVYQREPHARQMAFADVPQPKDYVERCELARRTCDDLTLDPTSVWIDRMDDRSRAAFGDLPSPAIVVDPFGVIRHKLPWAEPEKLEPLLAALQAGLAAEVAKQLAVDPRAEPQDAMPIAKVGARLWQLRRGAAIDERLRRPASLWTAAEGRPVDGWQLGDKPEWLDFVAAAAVVGQDATAAAARELLARLQSCGDAVVQDWAKRQAEARR